MFEESRINKINTNMASEEVLARRKIRVVKMDSLLAGGAVRGVVNLGGKEFQYQYLIIYIEILNSAIKRLSIMPYIERWSVPMKYSLKSAQNSIFSMKSTSRWKQSPKKMKMTMTSIATTPTTLLSTTLNSNPKAEVLKKSFGTTMKTIFITIILNSRMSKRSITVI